MSKPALLLDVDGVLNAIPEYVGPPGYTVHVIDGYVIHLHEQIAAMVAELERHYDIWWFTLWNHRAAMLMGPYVGLEEAPHLHTSWQAGREAMREQGYPEAAIDFLLYAKTPLLPRHLGLEDRWVWIDDSHGLDDHRYLTREGFDAANFRLLRTDQRVGLTWADVERAVGLLAELGTVPAEMDLEPATTHRPGSTAGRAQAVE